MGKSVLMAWLRTALLIGGVIAAAVGLAELGGEAGMGAILTAIGGVAALAGFAASYQLTKASEDNIIALAARREAAFIIHPLLRTAAAATDSGSESEPEDDARRGLGVSA